MSEVLRPGDPAPPLQLQPVFGVPVTVGPPGPPSILVFLRGLGSPSTRKMLGEIQDRHRELDGLQVVQFTTSPLELARDYVPRHHMLHPLVVDTTGEHYRAYGVGQDRGFVRTLLDLPGLAHMPARLSFGLGAHHPPFDQLPGAFVVGRDGKLCYCWIGRSIWNLPDLDVLLAAALGQ
jgi:peroxiredoxin